MPKRLCPECGLTRDPDCPTCGVASNTPDTSWMGEGGEQVCSACGEYLDDDGTCPACDTESVGRNIDRQQQIKYRQGNIDYPTDDNFLVDGEFS